MRTLAPLPPHLKVMPLWLALGSVALGCSEHHGRDDLVVGRDPTPGSGAAGGGKRSPGAGGTNGNTPAIAGSRALSAAIQNREGVTLDVVTVGCAGTCFEVVAVARGGYPPYTYVWEDGSTDPIRTICPDARSRFTVAATDRGYSSEEFNRDPETVDAEITAEVLACPDAGSPDAGTAQPHDGGAPDPTFTWEPLCVENGSFEDMEGYGWRICPPNFPGATAEIVMAGDGFPIPEPFDGAHYVQFTPQPDQSVSISQRLCQPIRNGTGYYWTLAMTLGSAALPVKLDIYFGPRECEQDGWFGTYAVTDAWAAVCANWPAQWDAQYVTIVARTESAGASAFIDQLEPVSELCPAP